MVTSSSARRTAARPFTRRREALLATALVLASASAQAQSLFDSMLNPSGVGQPGGYVFVSQQVSDTALIPLAREARHAGFTLVLNGFWGDLNTTRQRMARINNACCSGNGASWQVNPLLFQRYRVAAVPAFVIAVGPGAQAQDYSKLTGEMGVADALKTFAQQSKLPAVRRFAALTYTKAFATQ